MQLNKNDFEIIFCVINMIDIFGIFDSTNERGAVLGAMIVCLLIIAFDQFIRYSGILSMTNPRSKNWNMNAIK